MIGGSDMKFWIAHPAADSEPVSFRRWLAFKISERLYRWYRRLEDFALYPNGDDIPFCLWLAVAALCCAAIPLANVLP